MRAYVFAHLNSLPVIVMNYKQIRLGVYLRGEKSKRNYSGYFNFKKSFFKSLLVRLKIYLKNPPTVLEPKLIKMPTGVSLLPNYQFSEIPHWSNFFDELNVNRELVKNLFTNLLNKQIINSLKKKMPPVIGVHIRMGDFRKLSHGEDFSKSGSVRTPEQYFIDIIQSIRAINGKSLPVSVFTDGYAHEFNELLKINNVALVEGNKDIVDLILLSRSKIIITSAGSTFSYWAGFLSDSPIIMHPDHIHHSIRLSHESGYYEGPFDSENISLIDYIKKIHE
jgi:hypothetical protein